MIAKAARYVLVSRANSPGGSARFQDRGANAWGFVLRDAAGSTRLNVADEEPWTWGERLELLAAVRGLEAIDEPAEVSLVTDSRYVIRGIRFGIPAWRRDAWCWELHGEMVPVKNADLWKRLDHALQIHHVRSRWFRWDQVEAVAAGPDVGGPRSSVPRPHWLRRRDRDRVTTDGGGDRLAAYPPALRICCPE